MEEGEPLNNSAQRSYGIADRHAAPKADRPHSHPHSSRSSDLLMSLRNGLSKIGGNSGPAPHDLTPATPIPIPSKLTGMSAAPEKMVNEPQERVAMKISSSIEKPKGESDTAVRSQEGTYQYDSVLYGSYDKCSDGGASDNLNNFYSDGALGWGPAWIMGVGSFSSGGSFEPGQDVGRRMSDCASVTEVAGAPAQLNMHVSLTPPQFQGICNSTGFQHDDRKPDLAAPGVGINIQDDKIDSVGKAFEAHPSVASKGLCFGNRVSIVDFFCELYHIQPSVYLFCPDKLPMDTVKNALQRNITLNIHHAPEYQFNGHPPSVDGSSPYSDLKQSNTSTFTSNIRYSGNSNPEIPRASPSNDADHKPVHGDSKFDHQQHVHREHKKLIRRLVLDLDTSVIHFIEIFQIPYLYFSSGVVGSNLC